MKVSNERLSSLIANQRDQHDFRGSVTVSEAETLAALTELLFLRNAQSEAVAVKALGGLPTLRGLRAALARAEAYAGEYEFDSDEGCHTPSDIERMLMIDMLNGLFDDEQFVAALTHPAPPLAVTAPDGWTATNPSYVRKDGKLRVEFVHGSIAPWAVVLSHGNGASHAISRHDTATEALIAALEAKQ